jgi:hypothetical protein
MVETLLKDILVANRTIRKEEDEVKQKGDNKARGGSFGLQLGNLPVRHTPTTSASSSEQRALNGNHESEELGNDFASWKPEDWSLHEELINGNNNVENGELEDENNEENVASYQPTYNQPTVYGEDENNEEAEQDKTLVQSGSEVLKSILCKFVLN